MKQQLLQAALDRIEAFCENGILEMERDRRLSTDKKERDTLTRAIHQLHVIKGRTNV